jgi:hypothetical protein
MGHKHLTCSKDLSLVYFMNLTHRRGIRIYGDTVPLTERRNAVNMIVVFVGNKDAVEGIWRNTNLCQPKLTLFSR